MSINDGASSEIGSLQDKLRCVEIVRDDFKAKWEASIKDCLSLRARLEKAERVVEAAKRLRLASGLSGDCFDHAANCCSSWCSTCSRSKKYELDLREAEKAFDAALAAGKGEAGK